MSDEHYKENMEIESVICIFVKQIKPMEEKRFTLKSDYIELIKLLKLLNLAESGAHAKYMVEEGDVKLNGKTEYRKRAKIRHGDSVECNNIRILIDVAIKK